MAACEHYITISSERASGSTAVMGRQDGPDRAMKFSLAMGTPCELPQAATTASSLLPQSNIHQATGVTCAYASGTLIGSWLLVCVGIGGHKVVKPFVLYYMHNAWEGTPSLTASLLLTSAYGRKAYSS
jgi:hypothetical protein